MYNAARRFKKRSFHFFILNLAVMREIVRALNMYLKRNLLYLRPNTIRLLAEEEQVQINRPKVIAVIPHVTSVEEAKDREKGSAKVERLKLTIDGLMASLAHCELTIVVKTVADRHVTAYLPEYQTSCIHVQEETDCDPMFIGFRCQDTLMDKVDELDWFLFLEDDIIIHDSYILEKLGKFNKNCGSDRFVLLPHRYELWKGIKSYIDLTIETNNSTAWNKLSTVEIEGVKFAEFTNPHSGFFCLSKHQIQLWKESGRKWKDEDFGFGGSRECAATYSLLECFSLYKPHPSNLHFFEVRHYDTKYSELYSEETSYIFSCDNNLNKLNKTVEAKNN